jgi:hypothetical protein
MFGLRDDVLFDVLIFIHFISMLALSRTAPFLVQTVATLTADEWKIKIARRMNRLPHRQRIAS